MNSSLSLAKPTFACIRCSKRKVGCDKQNPCTACVRHNAPCVFRPPKESRKRRKTEDDGSVDERLKRYEALLREKGIDPNQVATSTATPEVEHRRESTQISEISQSIALKPSEVPETVWKLPLQAPIFKPQLRHGHKGTELVDNLWSRVAEEIHDNNKEEDSANDASDDDFAYVLGRDRPLTAPSHPPAELIHQLWYTFVENIDPLTKLVHVPSLQLAIEKAITNIEHIPRGFEALMFAIYSMAVLSLTDAECKELLGESRRVLLPRYVAATKVALSRARFMSSTSIVVMQALMLHIFSIRESEEPRAVWTLTGVAIRIGQGMGMAFDGTSLGLSPFETEIRRRIYWQLKMHDFRAAELSGQAKMRGAELDETTPKLPANVNDSDLYPTMPQAATESTRPTEMIWCMLRFELASFAAAQKSRLPKTAKGVFISDEYAAFNVTNMEVFSREMEDKIETKYLRFCDPSQPLQLMAMLGGRSTTNVVQFMIHHPRKWAKREQVPASEQQLVWNIVVQLLEQYNMMQSSPQLRRFAWIVPYFIQWHSVIHLLDTLRANALHLDAIKGWRLINTLYENNSELLLSTKRPIFVAVGNLCLKAYNARAAALAKEGRSLPDPPGYITKLREQRDAAKTRRQTATTKRKGQEVTKAPTLAPDFSATIRQDTNPMSVEALVQAAQAQQDHITQQPANSYQNNMVTRDDAFWLNDALDDDAYNTSGVDDMMNFDTYAMLAQDYWLDNEEGEVIDWAQWDAVVGGLNTV